MESVYPRKKRRTGERRQLDGYGGGQKTIRRPTIPGPTASDARSLGISLLQLDSYEGGFELLENLASNVLLINLERLKGMKCLKVYGGFGNLAKFEEVNMFWGMRKVEPISKN